MAKKTKETELPMHPLMVDNRSWDRHAVMAIICDAIATSSRSLGRILSAGHEGNTLPGHTAIMEWLAEDEELADKYAKAKESQADWMAEEMLEIADDARNDYMDQLGPDGQPVGYKINGEYVQRSRLRLDTRKWLASKLKPKKYGEKLDLNHSGEVKVIRITSNVEE